MLLAAVLLASTIIGPELTPPSAPTTPARGGGVAVAALSGGNVVALWTDNGLVAAQPIAGTPLRKTATIVGGGIPNSGPYMVAAAAIDNHAFAAWAGAGNAVSWVILDESAQVVARGDIHPAGAPYIREIAVTAVGNRYLVAWTSTGDAGGAFIDSGGAVSSTFRISSTAALGSISAASDGSRALLVTTSWNAVTITIVDGNGKATRAGTIAAANAESLRAAWDGGGYALAWLEKERKVHWLSWTDANGTPLAAPLQFAASTVAPVLAETVPGVTLFTSSYYGNFYARFGIGGRVIDNTAQKLPAALDSAPVTAAAFDGRRYYVVSAYGSVRGAATDLVSASTPVPLAFNPPQVLDVSVAVGDHQSFLGWSGSDNNASIVRFKERSFSGETPIHRFDTLVADGDGVAAVRVMRAELVDADGTLSSTMALPDRPSPDWIGVALAATRLLDGKLLAATTWTTGSISDVWATTFDRAHASDQRPFILNVARGSVRPIALSGSGRVAAWSDNRYRGWIARFDDRGIRLGGAIILDDGWIFDTPAMAVDGDGHALVLANVTHGINTTTEVLLVDLATMKIVRKTTTTQVFNREIVWTGEEYLALIAPQQLGATQQLDLMRISHDGVLQAPMHVTLPYPPFRIRMASGPAGALLVYTRLAPELGAGTVYRPFVRELHFPRRRAASR